MAVDALLTAIHAITFYWNLVIKTLSALDGSRLLDCFQHCLVISALSLLIDEVFQRPRCSFLVATVNR